MTLDDLATATPEHPVALGRYDVHGHLSTGGMGTVYRAVDREHGTEVALKTLNHLEPNNLLRFKNEFRAAADLSHPNLVRLYELGREGDVWYFTMERIWGRDFIRHLRGLRSDDVSGQQTVDAGALSAPTVESVEEAPSFAIVTREPSAPDSIEQLRDILQQLAEAIHALHSAGLLHLDIKPSNVLIDDDGRVVVLDFGLTRPVGFVEPEDRITIAGTPSQMAPEQYTGRGVAEAADWYGVGLMLYRALTGLPAFEAEGVVPTAYAKSNYAPTPPAQLLDELPRDLSDLAVALLNPEPSRRPTGLEVLAALGVEPTIANIYGSPVELIGREPERAVLAEALHATAHGGAMLVEIVGGSGVGKSALVGDLLARQSGEALALMGRCYERETVPYKAFDAMVDALAAHLEVADIAPTRWALELTHAFPVLSSVPSIGAAAQGELDTQSAVELGRRAVSALCDVFARLASAQPLIIAIDDLQWVDEASTLVLSKLLRGPLPAGLLLITSYRPHEASENPALDAYRAATTELASTRRLDLEPLHPDEAERLALRQLEALGADEPGLASEIARESEGVPFFVEELAHFAVQQDGANTVALEDVLARRVEALDPAPRRLVETLAVANTPIPLRTAFAVAEMAGEGELRALWSLQRQLFVRSSGAGASDIVELHHDRMREAVLSVTPEFRIDEVHLSLARALASDDERLYDAVRHYNAAAAMLDGDEREEVARLNLRAGALARSSAAFEVALDCFAFGASLLDADHWESAYDLMLGLHNGAAEAAYLQSEWQRSAAFVDDVKQNARSVLDQLPAREAEIDTRIAHNDFAGAVDCGITVLGLLGVELPSHPTPAEIESAITSTIGVLASVGPEGFKSLEPAEDDVSMAVSRVLVRISSAAYFGRPTLFGVIASTLVTSAVRDGLTPATPYALSVFAMVFNTLRRYRDAHAWGKVALELVPRFADRSLEARTGHCAYNLATNLLDPLAETVDNARRVVEIGLRTGDVEYAAYSAHTVVHNSFYAGLPLEPLWTEALDTSEFMRGYDQVNALHVHVLFERVIACFTGRAPSAASLDGDGFSEAEFLSEAEVAGSRSALFLGQYLMGFVRYYASGPTDAHPKFERARAYIDGAASTWHIPLFHQLAALTVYALPSPSAEDLANAAVDLERLEELAEVCPPNFAHRVELVRGAKARFERRDDDAQRHFDRASELAAEHGWPNDTALAHALAGRQREAAAAYDRWGASALAN